LIRLDPEQVCDPKRFQQRHHPLSAFLHGQLFDSVLDVLFDGQMRKEREVLEHISNPPFGDRQVDVRLRIEEQSRADGDPSGVRSREAGDAVEHRSFAPAGRAQEHREAGWGIEFDIDGKVLGGAMTKPHRQNRNCTVLRCSLGIHGAIRSSLQAWRFAGNTAQTRRLIAYVIERVTKEKAIRSNAMRFAEA